jgi:3-hydroxyacyl-[acyl-carrier-protein] dehydratase
MADAATTVLDSVQIRAIIPHRYPFLLVDRIVELEVGQRAVGLKNVTANEPFFQGHFPDYPVMPGVLIVEAMAQVGAVAILAEESSRGKLALFAGIDGVRFKRQVKPGDTLRMEVTLGQLRRNVGTGMAVATVDGEVACRGELTFVLIPSPTGS